MKTKCFLLTVLTLMLVSITSLRADISDSYIANNTITFTGPGTYDLSFQLYYFTPDAHEEYLEWFTITFPEGVTVNSASNAGMSNWLGETGNGVTTKWGDIYSVLPYVDVEFSVNVTVEEGFSGHINLNWWIQGSGDVWGWNQTLPPHEVDGELTILNYNPEAPEFAAEPFPADNSAVATDIDLQWTVGEDAESIIVLFDTVNPPVNQVYSGEPIESLSSSQIEGGLTAKTEYYWQVITENESAGNAGPIWSFTTGLPEGSYIVTTDSDGDYEGFAEVLADLNTYGVAGPVTFRFRIGNYVGSYQIDEIKGASETNTITFTSENTVDLAVFSRTDVTYTDRSLFRFFAAKHLRFDRLAFDNSHNWAWTFHFLKSSSDIQITNCVFTGTTSNAYIVASRSLVYTSERGSNVEDLLIEANVLTGGFSGIVINGDSGNYAEGIRIINNKMTGFTWDATRMSFVDAYEFRGNIIDLEQNGESQSRGVNVISSRGAFRFIGNRIYNARQYGLMYMNHIDDGEQALIANNMIGGGFTATSQWTSAIHLEGTLHNVGIYFNSLNLDATQQGSAFLVRLATTSQLDIRNNSFAYTGGGYGYAARMHPNNVSHFDYNNYYANGTNFVYYDFGNVGNLTSLQSIDGRNQNSKSGDPLYLSVTDLHSNGLQLWQAGTPIENITTDIDGDIRHLETPCIGADEYELSLDNDLAAIAITGPTELYLNNTYDFEVEIENLGLVWQYGYEVNLLDENHNLLQSITVYEEIWPNTTALHTLQWTPSTLLGEQSIYAKVINTGDGNPYNDDSPLHTVFVSIDTSVEIPNNELVTGLGNNYPNPFNPKTTISYSLEENVSELELVILNIRGQKVKTLISSESHLQGNHRIVWDGTDDLGKSVTSGIYFYRMTTPKYQQTRRMLLLK